MSYKFQVEEQTSLTAEALAQLQGVSVILAKEWYVTLVMKSLYHQMRTSLATAKVYTYTVAVP